jgi:hypothetical protein
LLLLQVTVEGAAADLEPAGDLGRGVAAAGVQLAGQLDLAGVEHRRAAAVAAASPGGYQPGGGALAHQVAFELGQGGEDVEDKLAAGGGGVDRLLERPEPDAALSQAGDDVDQMAQGAAEAVEFPDDQGVAGPELVEDLGEDGRSVRAPLAVSVNTR